MTWWPAGSVPSPAATFHSGGYWKLTCSPTKLGRSSDGCDAIDTPIISAATTTTTPASTPMATHPESIGEGGASGTGLGRLLGSAGTGTHWGGAMTVFRRSHRARRIGSERMCHASLMRAMAVVGAVAPASGWFCFASRR